MAVIDFKHIEWLNRRQWEDAGFDESTRASYEAAWVFNPALAKKLWAGGITPDLAARVVDRMPLGCWLERDNCTIDDAARLLAIEQAPLSVH